MQWSRNLVNGNTTWGKLKQGFQKDSEDKVIMVRMMIVMWHLFTSKYGQKDARNASPAHRSVLEQMTSWNFQYTAIGTIIRKNLLEVYSCEGYAVPRIWDDLGIF